MISFAKNIREQMAKKGAGKMFQVPDTVWSFLRKIEEKAKELEAGQAYFWRVRGYVYPSIIPRVTYFSCCLHIILIRKAPRKSEMIAL